MRKQCRLLFVSLSLLGGLALLKADPALAAPRAHHIVPSALPTNTRELFNDSMRIFDQSYDSNAHLLIHPPDGHDAPGGGFLIRESSWYALGLLTRDAPGDRSRAAGVLDAVLANQWATPGTKWFGTFRRSTMEPEPHVVGRSGRDYDPNWREFIGTTFQMILVEYSDRLPAGMADRLYHSIDVAVQGEHQDGRLVPTYSNIALMYGILWDFAANHDGNADWKQGSDAWTNEVYRLFRLHDSFSEYNSPTYYGTDLYCLGLWREYGSTPHIREMGTAMESALWSEIADYYQPQLRNVAGPYDRSYGMDMETYVSMVGLWLRTVMPAPEAPFPQKPSLSTDHVADIWFGPQLAILGTRIPPAAMAKFHAFSGPHPVHATIDDKRTATAWIGDRAIWGGEDTSLTRDVQGTSQFHAATLQWRTPAGPIGWMYLTRAPKLNVTADKNGLTIETSGDVSFRVKAAGMQGSGISAPLWNLPGMRVEVVTDGTLSGPPIAVTDLPAAMDLTYTNVHHMRLTIRPAEPTASARR